MLNFRDILNAVRGGDVRSANPVRLARLATVSAIAIASGATSALAQTSDAPAVDEATDSGMIVVTAQRREELSRDVPVTVTTVNEMQLVQANVSSLVDLPKLAPGVRFDQQGAYTQPVIRGIGNTIAYTAAGNSVGIYVDGFYVPNTLAIDFDFLNVEGVQVLKGPQGTLFGRNSTAGAILVATAEPEFETKGIVEASYERFDAKKIKGYFTMPLSEKVAFSAEGLFSKGDGFVRSIYNGSLASGSGFDSDFRIRNPGAYEKWTVRTGLKAELGDNTTIVLRYEHTDKQDPSGVMNGTWRGVVNGVAYPFSIGDTVGNTTFAYGRRDIALNQLADFRIKTNVLQLTARFDLGAADLTSYSQYREENIRHRLDSDYSSLSGLSLSLPEKAKVKTQELLLNSKPGGRLQYTAGLFFYAGESDTDIFFVLPGPAFTKFSGNGAKLRTYAAFGDVTYEVVDNLFLTGGLRYSHDVVKSAYQLAPFQPNVFVFAPDFKDDKLSPRFVVRYKPTEESSIYASYTKGYKSSFPDTGRTTGDTYKGGWYLRPEDMTAYEVGFKYAERSLSFDLAGFWYDYKNLQNSSYRVGNAVYSNAAQSRIKGIEAAVRYDLTPNIQLSAAGTYLDAKYRDYKGASFFNPIIVPDLDGDGVPDFAGFDTSVPADVSGRRVQRAPKFSGTFAARYSTDLAEGKLALSANLYHTSTVSFDPAHQYQQGAYDIVSARIQWTDPSDTYTIAIFGDNLLDETYLTQANVGTLGAGTVWGKPATYGISLRAEM